MCMDKAKDVAFLKQVMVQGKSIEKIHVEVVERENAILRAELENVNKQNTELLSYVEALQKEKESLLDRRGNIDIEGKISSIV